MYPDTMNIIMKETHKVRNTNDYSDTFYILVHVLMKATALYLKTQPCVIFLLRIQDTSTFNFNFFP